MTHLENTLPYLTLNLTHLDAPARRVARRASGGEGASVGMHQALSREYV